MVKRIQVGSLLGVVGVILYTSGCGQRDRGEMTRRDDTESPTVQQKAAPKSDESATHAPAVQDEPTVERARSDQPRVDAPPYVRLVEREHAGEVQLETRVENGRVIIEARNVQRLRLDRAGLDLPRNRSVPLFVNGQGIEWRSQHREIIVELNTTTGFWSARPADEQ